MCRMKVILAGCPSKTAPKGQELFFRFLPIIYKNSVLLGHQANIQSRPPTSRLNPPETIKIKVKGEQLKPRFCCRRAEKERSTSEPGILKFVSFPSQSDHKSMNSKQRCYIPIGQHFGGRGQVGGAWESNHVSQSSSRQLC